MRPVKTVYCIVAISIALILASVGGLLGIITAIIVLTGALPMFNAVWRTASNVMLTIVENRNRERATPKASHAEELSNSDRRGIPPATHR
jgi:hypothetical protein